MSPRVVPALTPALTGVRAVDQFLQVSLLGLLASGFLALAFSGYLDLIPMVLTAAGLLFRAAALFARRPEWSVSQPLANALTLAYIGFYPIDYIYVSGDFIPATVHLICFLSVVRILSARTSRDYFFVKLLAFLELVAATLLSSNISFFVFLTTSVVFGVATFCCSEILRSTVPPLRVVLPRGSFHGRLAGMTLAITMGIVIMTAGLFVLLPRTARMAFRSLVPDKYHITGFANEISLGQLGRIQKSTIPLMHVRPEIPGARLPLKWRGGVLTRFDGRRWFNPRGATQRIPLKDGLATVADDDQRRRPGERIQYRVRIDSIDADTLFFGGIPEFVQINIPYILRTPEGIYRTGLGYGTPSQYAVTSFRPETEVGSFAAPPLSLDMARESLLLPPVDPRMVELTRRVDPGGAASDRARAFERYLRANFAYSLDLLDKSVEDPLANFLFERKAGHCEYFASAMAVMLRLSNIPSRVATGFQSGVYNPLTGWQVLRASDAHSWVEAWIPGNGWMTFDPTPLSTSPSGKPWTNLAMYLDTVQMFWQRWVVDYDLEHQLYLASRVEQTTRNWKAGPFDWSIANALSSLRSAGDRFLLAGAALGGLLIFIAAIWLGVPAIRDTWRSRRHARRIRSGGAGSSDAAILYLRLLAILRRRGYEKPAWLTPAEFARLIPESGLADQVSEFTRLYHDLRYGNRAAAGEQMLGMLQQLELKASGSSER